jgi:hypothetical protein
VRQFETRMNFSTYDPDEPEEETPEQSLLRAAYAQRRREPDIIGRKALTEDEEPPRVYEAVAVEEEP